MNRFHCIVLLSSLLLINFVVGEEEECQYDEFACESGNFSCIPNNWVCDGFVDCNDKSDEENCAVTECSGFTCKSSSHCLPRAWECDGEEDCEDGSDEENCGVTECPGFTCSDDPRRCLPPTWQCDGVSDCFDGSDEEGCEPSSGTSCPGFQCPGSGRCISEHWTCDGEDDCEGGEDETEEACPCKNDEFRCPRVSGQKEPGWCIPQEWICDEDGIWDCPEGKDEENCNNGHDNNNKTHPHPPVKGDSSRTGPHHQSTYQKRASSKNFYKLEKAAWKMEENDKKEGRKTKSAETFKHYRSKKQLKERMG